MKGVKQQAVTARDSASKLASARSIPAPNDLELLMGLANSLPTTHRKSNGKGIHHLTQMKWNLNDDQETVHNWFYLRRYINELPPFLQAFVLHDDEGKIVVDEFPWPRYSDPKHIQPYNNLDLLRTTENEHQLIVEHAWQRIMREAPGFRIPEIPVQSSPGTVCGVTLTQAEQLMDNYIVGSSKYHKTGAGYLLQRARKRFFFVLAAEEILNALTSEDPNRELETDWYFDEAGAVYSFPYFEDDQLHMDPPVLMEVLIGVSQLRRIRKCVECHNYFWASRTDKILCSERCSARRRKQMERTRRFEVKVGDRTQIPRIRKNPKS